MAIDPARFWSHVMLPDDSADGCWIWTGALRDDGTGRYFVSERKEMRAPHVAYEIQTGRPVPFGYRLRRTCGEPRCVRHWELDRPYRKLSSRDHACIEASWLRTCDLMRMYRVSWPRIYQIRQRRRTVLT